MITKKVEKIITPPAPHFVGDGFRVHNFIPGALGLNKHRMNPFIIMDYNSKYYFSPTDQPRGVGAHPHKGFETVTIAYKGKIAHRDSFGNSGIIEEGDVQWMTAASGILHKEYHEEEFSKEGGDFQMVQLWINLPAKVKKEQPRYQAISNDQIKKHQLPNKEGVIEIIAGNYKDKRGSASTFTPVNLFNAKLNKGTEVEFSFPASYNTSLLVIEGAVKINNEEIATTDQFALFENLGESFTVEALDQTIVLILSAEPINEPIISQGPFVMNTREEISQAFEEFRNGKFGNLD